MLSIFQTEISQLEVEAVLIAQRIYDLREAETKLEQATATLTELINTAQPLGKLADIKRMVLDLFKGDEPEPTPPDESLPIIEAVEALQRDDFMVEVAKLEPEPQPETEPEPIHPRGYTELRHLTDDVAYLVNARGEVMAGYAGFTSKRKAEAKGKELSELLAMGYEVRSEGNPKKRLPHKYELRLLDISMSQLERLAAEMKPVEATPQTPAPIEDLPEFKLIPDTSVDCLLGNSWFVYGNDNPRTSYGKVNESLTLKGFRYGKQRDNTVYQTPEDAAIALIRAVMHDRKLHSEMNTSIVEKYLAG